MTYAIYNVTGLLARRTQAPLLIARKAHLYLVHAPYDTEIEKKVLHARIVETRSPRCHCSSRFTNLTSPKTSLTVSNFTELKCDSLYACLHYCLHRFKTDRATLAHRPDIIDATGQLAFKHVAKILLCHSHLYPALMHEYLSWGKAQADIVHGALFRRSVVFLKHVCRLQVWLARQRVLLLSMCLGSRTLLKWISWDHTVWAWWQYVPALLGFAFQALPHTVLVWLIYWQSLIRQLSTICKHGKHVLHAMETHASYDVLKQRPGFVPVCLSVP